MKKILSLVALLSVLTVSAAYCAEQTTVTEKFIQKHTSKIVNKEKELQSQYKAQKDKAEAQKKANEEKQKAQKQKVETKKKAWKELTTF